MDGQIGTWAKVHAALYAIIKNSDISYTAAELYELDAIKFVAKDVHQVSKLCAELYKRKKVGRLPVSIPGSHARYAYVKKEFDAIQNKVRVEKKVTQPAEPAMQVLSVKPKIVVHRTGAVTIEVHNVSILIEK